MSFKVKIRNNIFEKLFLLFLPILFVFGFSFSANTQIYQKGDVNIGIEGGVQFTNISASYTSNTPTSGVGYSIGPYVEYHVSPTFKLRLGMNYDNRGYGLNETRIWADQCGDSLVIYNSSYIQLKRDYKVNYLTIPLSVFYVKGNEKFKIYIQFSFYYSLYLNAYQTGFNDLYISENDYQNICDSTLSVGHNIKEIDGAIEKGFNSSDFGINFYIGGIIRLSPSLGLSIAPGFTFGMANVYEDPVRESRWTRIFKINAGIVYTLKKK